MAKTPSTMLDLGTPVPDFQLPDPTGRYWSLEDFPAARGLAIVFICNHCPYVIHMAAGLAQFADDYQARGLQVIAISANDVSAYPADGLEKMALAAKEWGFNFPYLYDETQQVAKAFKAACTPDLFLFDGNRQLVYRGQFDGSRPGNDVPVSGSDLRAAADAVLAGKPVVADQHPSLGCNIKWKPGNEPEYF